MLGNSLFIGQICVYFLKDSRKKPCAKGKHTPTQRQKQSSKHIQKTVNMAPSKFLLVKN